ncbi:heterogeneous nuclear ribonucleoprotein 1-like [Gossypium australe]|uniref:Heterogeneous nuclear ribonucleoprotein 1-like n=1 Tax=Gossypium australe TaxID=47621 RepID=A0A5B6VQC9_9ROSI|nr:heterogeneous nuclear ribonucleoprotein 1-like [Gossypium australe]
MIKIFHRSCPRFSKSSAFLVAQFGEANASEVIELLSLSFWYGSIPLNETAFKLRWLQMLVAIGSYCVCAHFGGMYR